MVLLGALALGSGALATAYLLRARLGEPFPPGDRAATFFLVETGASTTRIAQALEREGLISSALLFRLYLRWSGAPGLQAGEYRFEGPLSIPEVAGKLRRGEVYYHRVTVPEGTAQDQVADFYLEAGFGTRSDFASALSSPALIADLDPAATDLEGYLFPDTYYLTRGTTAEEIVRQMVGGFRRVWTEELRNRASQLGLTVRETITLASLIEKETARPDERPLISAVFHNRLRQNIKLACDPTVIYAVKRIQAYDGIIHLSDLRLDSPYNTYLYPGLPPGPIANPGRASILAALYPAESDYLFFVSRNDGSHHFSSNYRDHNRAVREFQR